MKYHNFQNPDRLISIWRSNGEIWRFTGDLDWRNLEINWTKLEMDWRNWLLESPTPVQLQFNSSKKSEKNKFNKNKQIFSSSTPVQLQQFLQFILSKC